MDREAWWATVHVVRKESDTTEAISTQARECLQSTDEAQPQTLI